jgi:hypothetical protein
MYQPMFHLFYKITIKIKLFISLLLNFIFVVLRISLFKPRIIYIGDSHAHFISGNKKNLKRFSVTHDNKLIIYLGPKLLYWISVNGFRLNKTSKVVLRIAGNKQCIVIVLGEIDCRVHFVEKTLFLGTKEFDKIALGYKNSVIMLLNTYRLSRAFIIAPIPASDLGLDNPRFPRGGLLHERVLVTKMLTESLVSISSFQFTVMDCFSVVSNNNGSLNIKYTDDGVHLNFFGLKKLTDNTNFKNI